MLRLASDENFNGDVLRGLLRREPALDLVRIQDAGLLGAEDAEILAWAADNNRVLLTHDISTMPFHAFNRVRAGLPMPGVFVLGDKFPIGKAIEEILLAVQASDATEWADRVEFLPF